jgi:hypothetical protein
MTLMLVIAAATTHRCEIATSAENAGLILFSF